MSAGLEKKMRKKGGEEEGKEASTFPASQNYAPSWKSLQSRRDERKKDPKRGRKKKRFKKRKRLHRLPTSKSNARSTGRDEKKEFLGG